MRDGAGPAWQKKPHGGERYGVLGSITPVARKREIRLNEADFVGGTASTFAQTSRLLDAATFYGTVRLENDLAGRWLSLYCETVRQAIEPAGGLPWPARHAASSQNVAEDTGIANRTGTETRAIVAKLV